jgi:predicted small lipoprotein YifL
MGKTVTLVLLLTFAGLAACTPKTPVVAPPPTTPAVNVTPNETTNQSFWDSATLYTTASIPGAFSIPAVGDYFYVSVPNKPGGRWEAIYNETYIALIDTRNIGGSSENSEFLFRALASGDTQIVISGFGENMTYSFVILQSPLPPP